MVLIRASSYSRVFLFEPTKKYPMPTHLRGFGIVGLMFFAIFVLMMLLSFIPYPSYVRLPLSAIGDYVEVPDGDVYIVSEWFNRVFRYSKEGAFVATYPYPSGMSKSVHLATSGNNDLFFFTPRSAYLVTSEMKIIKEIEGNRSHRTWVLLESGIPELALDRESEYVQHHAVTSGELLVGDSEKSSPAFHNKDGTFLIEDGMKVARFSKDGVKLIEYGTPIYLILFVAPFPWMLYGVFFAYSILNFNYVNRSR